MSMLDSFFNKGFKGAKCKTLLKLTIPRIKLLRNRREIQIKQMRKDIAKLLENGQEATARIRVEHIIREENIMAAQEIIELFCELIAVRLPIIETQRECPLDLKEAISSICFAAPRCADLPELLQVQMLFAAKYGKEFVSAATELIPDCGVNRQIIELLSVRAPPAEIKLKLLKEIAEEHDLEWDPAASETEFFKPHEDLLNGPTQFVSGSQLPLPKEKHDEALQSAPVEALHEQSDSDSESDSLDFPEVPKMSLRPIPTVSAPEMFPPPNQTSPDTGLGNELNRSSGCNENILHEPYSEPETIRPETVVASPLGSATDLDSRREEKQFLPFISPPSLSSASFSTRQSKPATSLSRTRSEIKSETNVDLQDVLAAAHAAAESAERAAAAARSAASLAEIRITELIKKKNDQSPQSSEHSSYTDVPDQSATVETPHFDHQQSFGNADHGSYSLDPHPDQGSDRRSVSPNPPSYDSPKVGFESPPLNSNGLEHESTHHQPQRLSSLDEDPYFSYPNLFRSQSTNQASAIHPTSDNSPTTHDL
ncbi:protein of unknown function DUF292 [Macleaya cordata]|uniref:Vacuolar protein sorting-associated protein Ist1 n=1 Tax=Macleaya cordata TaxID=56857 RepID=A0A200Q810_MACCD|nr:protein of unknown function DUF292 [Macleaya cordata]